MPDESLPFGRHYQRTARRGRGFPSARVLTLVALAACQAQAHQSVSVEEAIARGRSHEARGEPDEALSVYEDLVDSHPDDWRGYMLRGSLSFRLGENAKALSDFDAIVGLAPEQEPYLWQRGISQYYEGRYAACAEQFELHRTVNGADVENSVWHFLCRAKLEGPDGARAKLLPVGPDPRVPMSEVYELFAGRLGVDDVLEAARSETRNGAMSLFYAELYVGLFLEATGDVEAARPYFTAAARSPVGGYMRDVARLHLAKIER